MGTEHPSGPPRASSPRRTPRLQALLLGPLAMIATACGFVMPSSSPTPIASLPPSATSEPTATPTPAPTATATPLPLSLAPPAKHDLRRIRFSISSAVPARGTGTLTVRVTNLSGSRITEIVLRWPTPLNDIVFLAPFQPSPGRLTTELVQPWTKWVIGPGEMGEPAGTTSLGWGPLDSGATLTIPLVATRRQTGSVAFDLQFLAGEALLTTTSGGPAETRVSL